MKTKLSLRPLEARRGRPYPSKRQGRRVCLPVMMDESEVLGDRVC